MVPGPRHHTARPRPGCPHGRTAEEARAAVDRLIATEGADAARLHPYGCDLASLEEVKAWRTASWTGTGREEERTVRRLNRPADLLDGRVA